MKNKHNSGLYTAKIIQKIVDRASESFANKF